MNTNYIKKIFLILFLDLFAYSAIIPLLPILFLDSEYFLSGISSSKKMIFLGLLYAVYPLFQTLLAPFWAKVADKIGRKRMLQFSFIGNFLGYLISSMGVFTGTFSFLVIGNAVAGALGVNISTINALISDATSGQKRVKYFGFVNLLLGASFAIGPFLSAKVVPMIPHIETVALGFFLIAAILALVNFVLISTISVPQIEAPLVPREVFDIKSIKKEAFYPLCLVFLTTFGWYLFIKTFQIFLLESGHYQPSEVLNFVAFYGICTTLAQGLFVSGIYKKLSQRFILNLSLFGLALSIALFALQPGFFALHIHILAISLFQSMISPNLLGVYSKNHTPEIHGQMMSAHLGMMSFAKILAPGLSGLIIAFSPALSIISSSLVVLLAACMLPLLFKESEVIPS